MRRINIGIILFLSSSLLCACTNAIQPLTPVELHSLIIEGSWELQKLVIAGREKPGTLPGMSVSFTPERFIAYNAPADWPQNSSWHFKNKEATIIEFEENKQLSL